MLSQVLINEQICTTVLDVPGDFHIVLLNNGCLTQPLHCDRQCDLYKRRAD